MIITITKFRKSKINNIDDNINVIKNNINITATEEGYIINKDDGTQVVTNSLEEAEWYQFDPNYNPEPVHID